MVGLDEALRYFEIESGREKFIQRAEEMVCGGLIHELLKMNVTSINVEGVVLPNVD
tara:strand:- start:1982 stop:2149 length:168 start_codon:yes stop_codon:yes gene_type:complete